MRITAAILTAAALSLASISAQAMPFQTSPAGDDTAIVKVWEGCGPGWTRGPYGHCRPMYNCPPGWHPGPFGHHCFRNW